MVLSTLLQRKALKEKKAVAGPGPGSSQLGKGGGGYLSCPINNVMDVVSMAIFIGIVMKIKKKEILLKKMNYQDTKNE